MLKVSLGQSPPRMTSSKVHLAQELLPFSYSSIHLTSMEESPEEKNLHLFTATFSVELLTSTNMFGEQKYVKPTSVQLINRLW